MNQELEYFLQSLIKAEKTFNETEFFQQGCMYLDQQLKRYLSNEGVAVNTFSKSIASAQQLNNVETSKRFWDALKAFDVAAGNHALCKYKTVNKRWLRFVNIIEELQGYSGSQLFSGMGLKKARLYRLYFSYMLTWEHLRYIAGDDDKFSPSSMILETFAAGYDDDHDHDHDHHHHHHDHCDEHCHEHG